MSLRKEDQLFTIDYPESDGEPMAETDVHYRLMTDLRFELERFFRDDADVYVSGNILLYYVEGNPKKRVAPDVLVARGVRKAIAAYISSGRKATPRMSSLKSPRDRRGGRTSTQSGGCTKTLG
jgi:hypothetical protein